MKYCFLKKQRHVRCSKKHFARKFQKNITTGSAQNQIHDGTRLVYIGEIWLFLLFLFFHQNTLYFSFISPNHTVQIKNILHHTTAQNSPSIAHRPIRSTQQPNRSTHRPIRCWKLVTIAQMRNWRPHVEWKAKSSNVQWTYNFWIINQCGLCRCTMFS